jgi:hypothetical protein
MHASSSSPLLVPLPSLELAGYRATTFDYDPPTQDLALSMPGKREWVAVFRNSIHEFQRRAAKDARVVAPGH